MTDRSNHEIALAVCGLLDLFHGVEASKCPFYEVEDIAIKYVFDKKSRASEEIHEFDAEIHGFFACGDTPQDALLRLEGHLKYQLRKASVLVSARQRREFKL